jgi:hypothetical protein
MKKINQKNDHINEITLDLHIVMPGDPDFCWVEIHIDGKPLAKLVNTFEKNLMSGSVYEKAAGNYWYLHPFNLLESWENPKALAGGLITILEYSWMPVDYRPIVAQMRQEDDYILWDNFRQLREPNWDYSSFGSFRFRREQFSKELTKLRSSL